MLSLPPLDPQNPGDCHLVSSGLLFEDLSFDSHRNFLFPTKPTASKNKYLEVRTECRLIFLAAFLLFVCLYRWGMPVPWGNVVVADWEERKGLQQGRAKKKSKRINILQQYMLAFKNSLRSNLGTYVGKVLCLFQRRRNETWEDLMKVSKLVRRAEKESKFPGSQSSFSLTSKHCQLWSLTPSILFTTVWDIWGCVCNYVTVPPPRFSKCKKFQIIFIFEGGRGRGVVQPYSYFRCPFLKNSFNLTDIQVKLWNVRKGLTYGIQPKGKVKMGEFLSTNDTHLYPREWVPFLSSPTSALRHNATL